MAPSKPAAAVAPYSKDERVLCFHHEMLYEAKVLDSRATEDQSWEYKIHYKGWKNTVSGPYYLLFLVVAEFGPVMGKSLPSRVGESEAREAHHFNAMAPFLQSEEIHSQSSLELLPKITAHVSWDDWVPQDRVRKFTDENKELAAQLHTQMKALQSRPTKALGKKGGKAANGSDLSSTRGSEERHTSAAATAGARGRGSSGDSDSTLIMEPPILKRPLEEEASVSSPRKRLKRGNSKGNIVTRGIKNAPPPSWSKPGNPDWNIQKVLESEYCVAQDHLLKLPEANFTYISNNGHLKNRDFYHQFSQTKPPPKQKIHPKLQEHINKKTDTAAVYRYYSNLPHDRVMPIAGMIFDEDEEEDEESLSFELNGPSSDGARRSISPTKSRKPTKATKVTKVANRRLSPMKSPELEGRSGRKIFEKDFCFEKWVANVAMSNKNQEENFHARPSIQLPIPDHIKAILVDDWENVTKNQQLVPLPSAKPVVQILDDYYQYEALRRIDGSSQADILEEVVAGLKDYFEKCLGRVLLYRFERAQYTEVRAAWAVAEGELAGKTAIETYGAEHLCRLLVSLPELIAQTNMDQQSVNRLREELMKLTSWLGKNAETYFVKEYETPGADYVERARGV
ncbi:Chromatin modification-related protein eaf3 [Lachnellula suecica]|uniref:Chromatin modification-related protein EAF3 n=1 Tax=Lachnellula suecica TaxID=602035 RepID=A0A8T9C882_9HELO|nr:Chromatin modification-related protein eaf3 [Lachnellula suecica]